MKRRFELLCELDGAPGDVFIPMTAFLLTDDPYEADSTALPISSKSCTLPLSSLARIVFI